MAKHIASIVDSTSDRWFEILSTCYIVLVKQAELGVPHSEIQVAINWV